MTVEWSALGEVLYDSPYSSFLWHLIDPYGRIVNYHDAWTHPVSVEEGIHRMILDIWHKDASQLEKLKQLPLTFSQPMDSPVPIQFSSSLSAAASLQPGRFTIRTVDENQNHSTWIYTQGEIKAPNLQSGIQTHFMGEIQWLNKSAHHQAVLHSKVIQAISDNSPFDSDKATVPQFAALDQDLDTSWWGLRLARLEQLAPLKNESEAFEALYHTMQEERPESLELRGILLNRLDDQDRKKHLNSILPLIEEMIIHLNANEIRDYFAVRRTPETKADRYAFAQMSKNRDLLLDLFYRKSRALAYLETVEGEQTDAFNEALNALRSWVDTGKSPYRLLDIRDLRRNEKFGSALKLLNQSIHEKPDNLLLLEKRVKILNSLKWPYWAEYAHQKAYLKLPNLVKSVVFDLSR